VRTTSARCRNSSSTRSRSIRITFLAYFRQRKHLSCRIHHQMSPPGLLLTNQPPTQGRASLFPNSIIRGLTPCHTSQLSSREDIPKLLLNNLEDTPSRFSRQYHYNIRHSLDNSALQHNSQNSSRKREPGSRTPGLQRPDKQPGAE
jgi:hypothetical protein